MDKLCSTGALRGLTTLGSRMDMALYMAMLDADLASVEVAACQHSMSSENLLVRGCIVVGAMRSSR